MAKNNKRFEKEKKKQAKIELHKRRLENVKGGVSILARIAWIVLFLVIVVLIISTIITLVNYVKVDFPFLFGK